MSAVAHPRATRPALEWVNLALLMAGVVVIGLVANYFAARPWLRVRIDATRTRAYSLSPQTRALLDGLQGDWTIAMVLGGDRVGEDQLRQVSEVLSRYDQASDRVRTLRIDPADPAMLGDYEGLLADLRAIYSEPVAAHEEALDAGRGALAGLTVLLEQHGGALVTARQRLDADGGAAAAGRPRLDGVLGVIGLRLEQAPRLEQEVAAAMSVDEARPLPDYDTARSILAAALSGWGQELFELGRSIDAWRQEPDLPAALREYAAWAPASLRAEATALAAAADPLQHLPPLELSRLARSLEQGEAAVVMGPQGAAVISSAQLFPTLNLRRREGGEIAFDQRFRGEQAIAAALRSLLVERAPMVVLVHAQGQSMLKRRDGNVDALGAATVLGGSRYDVTEWNVGQSDRPRPAAGQKAVWVVLPPPVVEKREAATGEAERRLIDATETLLEDGEAVLLSLAPSVLPRLGQKDPWRGLVAPLGLDADTGRVVYERMRDAESNVVNQRMLQVVNYESIHPIAAAAHGLQTSFDLPVALRIVEPAPAGVVRIPVATLDAAENRWLESDWMLPPDRLGDPDPSERLTADEPIVVAVERVGVHPGPGAGNRGRQRAIVVGSGGWALSYIADVTLSAGGGRAVLLNPGNYELLQASIAWLADADDMIAPSPVSRQVARLEGVGTAAQTLWRWIAVALVPGACLLLGVAVWFMRRA